MSEDDELRNLFGPKIGDEYTEYVPPDLITVAREAWIASRRARAEAPVAAAEGRCVSPPMGCGQPLGKPVHEAFRDAASRREYAITGTCQACQDRLWAPEEGEDDE